MQKSLLGVFASLACVLWLAVSPAEAQLRGTFDNASVARGDTLVLKTQSGQPWPAIGTTRIVLERQGKAIELSGPVVVAGGGLSAVVPPRVPLGDYDVRLVGSVTATFESRLRVRPPVDTAAVLDLLAPAMSYDVVTAYRRAYGEAKPQPIVNRGFTVRDTGAVRIAPAPPENINGLKVDRIDWRYSSCAALPPLPTKERPSTEVVVFGVAAGNGLLELCRVPAESAVLVDGARVTHITESSPATAYYRLPSASGARTAVSTVRVTVRGSGFLVNPLDDDDNAVWLNDVRQPVIWDSCGDGNEATSTADGEVHGEIISHEEMRLCGLPVPERGELRLAVGHGDTRSAQRVLRVFSMTPRRVFLLSALIAATLALLPLGLLTVVKRQYVIGDRAYRFRALFLDPETDTYSLSKLQFYLWTIAAIFGYAYLFISRVKVQFATWPDVPGTLPGMIAVAGGTAVGSQVITAFRGSKGAGEQRPSIADFITTGGVVAVDRLQMFLWTLFGVGAFVYAVLEQGPGTIAELPAVPERLLTLMGLSSAGYLAGKMARKAGPVIHEIAIVPSQSDDAIVKARAASETVDLKAPIQAANVALGALAASTGTHTKGILGGLARAVETATAALTTSGLNALVASVAELREKADKAAADAAAVASNGQTVENGDAQDAQRAAAAVQDFYESVALAVSDAAKSPMRVSTGSPLITRTIELRGTSLSCDATVEIDHADLPFRMLLNGAGQHAPEVVVRDDVTPTLARVMRLVIDPAKLEDTDLEQVHAWFGADARHVLTLTNPDGQKADVSFSLPPAAASTQSTSTGGGK